ncbi:hypothetical protein OG439_40390 [Amycolatopsis sp. NBC_01307]|uniref:hypothetical protein n=1 Tax=Amycolatopsis sp. NBC_01307 TaxID=2903561 RepID=UPI002E15483A|nr:hypothetical protein OG439_40390 [Amycolatopsis sp. NBC_01307]
MAAGESDAQRHLVVFDCNIYLDVARLLVAPFSWDNFDQEVARLAKVKVPHPTDKSYDSLRAIATCTSGLFVGSETLEVWTNAHIDRMVRGKAEEATTPDDAGYCGLGWDPEDADALVDDLVWGVVESSNGGTLGKHYPHGHPPLDYEDGMVFGACRALASEDPLARIYCVTRDNGFIAAYEAGRLGDVAYVMRPSRFVAFMRQARAQYAMQKMKP